MDDEKKENNDDGKDDDTWIKQDVGMGGYTSGENTDNGGKNWFDDDNDTKDDNDGKTEVASASQTSGARKRGPSAFIFGSRERGQSAFNKKTANESINIDLRCSGVFGPFSTLQYVIKMDKECHDMDKKGKLDETKRYIIEELFKEPSIVKDDDENENN
eukprot:CAMPEP_0114686428 /NCGR_PEP_ID=MMETSP0191-20121206/61477_1 /TAXON_ID=126664 /ORGANISM="Sorites sp." /LENGTH=158 /DNA_ID=CAMNT_0001971919 /DNA_START=470 /DNA_END=943 /DNA_ORIENTATION=+